jgi:cytochrome c biogenesis factor
MLQMLDKFFDLLSSMKTAIFVFLLIVIASVVGTTMPQRVADFYIYKTLWFQGLIFFLMISVIYCRVLTFPKNLKRIGSYMVHLSIPLILIGGMIGYFYGEKGTMQIFEKEMSHVVMKEDQSQLMLPFSLFLDDFILEKHPHTLSNKLTIVDANLMPVSEIDMTTLPKSYSLQNGMNIEVVDLIPYFSMDEMGNIIKVSDEWQNPAIRIKVGEEEGWLFARYPQVNMKRLWAQKVHIFYESESKGGEIKDYKSVLRVVDGGNTVLSKTIEVNDPLKYKGYTFYQSSYDPESLSWTGLQVKKDPGVLVVYTGSILMILGFFIQYFSVAGHVKEGKNAS